MLSCLTKDEMLVCLKYCLLHGQICAPKPVEVPCGKTYDKTLEKSAEGDMMKLSALADHEIRCWMFWSSSMLSHV